MGLYQQADRRVDVIGDLVIIAQPDPSLDQAGRFHWETDEFARPTVTLLHPSHTIK
jgi:hypothetical protein